MEYAAKGIRINVVATLLVGEDAKATYIQRQQVSAATFRNTIEKQFFG